MKHVGGVRQRVQCSRRGLGPVLVPSDAGKKRRRPPHLLFPHQPLADHLVHRGFDESGRDGLAVSVAVRITNDATGHVFCARTANRSSMPIKLGTHGSTTFIVPGTSETGPSVFVVAANGIASQGAVIVVN